MNQKSFKVDENETFIELRKLYNYIKHRSPIAYTGVNENQKPIMRVSLDGKTKGRINYLSRRTKTILEVENLLSGYHFALEDAACELIEMIMPQNYKALSINAGQFFATTFAIVEEQNKGK